MHQQSSFEECKATSSLVILYRGWTGLSVLQNWYQSKRDRIFTGRILTLVVVALILPWKKGKLLLLSTMNMPDEQNDFATSVDSTGVSIKVKFRVILRMTLLQPLLRSLPQIHLQFHVQLMTVHLTRSKSSILSSNSTVHLIYIGNGSCFKIKKLQTVRKNPKRSIRKY